MRSLLSTLLLVSICSGTVAIGETIPAGQQEFYNYIRVVPDAAGKAARPLQQAVDHFRGGRSDECRAALEEAARLSPALPPPDVMLARMYLHVGNDAEALRRLDRLAVQFADEPEVFVSLGELALRQGRLTDAWLQLERANTLAPPKTWDDQRRKAFREELAPLRGQAAERREDYSESERIYREWMESSKESAPAVLGLARSRLMAGKPVEAVALFNQAKKLDPKTPAAETLIALISMRRGDIDSAETWLKKALASRTVEPAARLDFARWLLEQDRPDEAQKQLDAVPDNSETDTVRLFLRGLVARSKGDLDAAETAFSKLHQATPTDWQAADQLALVLIERSDEAKRMRAAQLAQTNLRQSRDRTTALATAGWVQLRLGDIGNAERLLQQALSAGPPSPPTRYYVSRLFAAQGRQVDAEKWLTDALKQGGLWIERRNVCPKLDGSNKQLNEQTSTTAQDSSR